MNKVTIIGKNVDLAVRAQEAAAININLQIDNIARAEGGLKLAMHDAVVQLIDAPCWKTGQRIAWKEDLLAAMMTGNEQFIMGVIHSNTHVSKYQKKNHLTPLRTIYHHFPADVNESL